MTSQPCRTACGSLPGGQGHSASERAPSSALGVDGNSAHGMTQLHNAPTRSTSVTEIPGVRAAPGRRYSRRFRRRRHRPRLVTPQPVPSPASTTRRLHLRGRRTHASPKSTAATTAAAGSEAVVKNALHVPRGSTVGRSPDLVDRHTTVGLDSSRDRSRTPLLLS